MAEKQKLGSQKRFGPRYGRKLRMKVAAIEQEQRKLHKCPYCKYEKVKRVALGIWGCSKCKAKFSGRAYTVGGKK
ncbi:MAG: 50S ribosomal protein L37ae [Nanoarchaeota archaeon]|nr:50S ribosomal protein L37ae [Nanoarchaeota archaeon]